LAKAGVSCFYESDVLNPSFVHLMKFSAGNPRLRKAAKRYGSLKEETTNLRKENLPVYKDFSRIGKIVVSQSKNEQ